jgi:hypothetical protein
MMGAREWLSGHPKAAIAIGCAMVVLTAGVVVAELRAQHHRYPSGPPESYFTVDDGKSFFAASSDNIPPFDYDGQQAVRAYVFQCGGHRFVGYMERFSTKYHDQVVAHGLSPEAMRFGRELKKPGDAKWVPSGDLRFEAAFTDIHCPDGSSDVPQAVEP